MPSARLSIPSGPSIPPSCLVAPPGPVRIGERWIWWTGRVAIGLAYEPGCPMRPAPPASATPPRKRIGQIVARFVRLP